MYINGAPRVFRDKVIIGNGGTEVGANRGYVTAYDTETGKQAWRFYIVPGNPADGFEDETQAMAAKTWTGEWWKHGGGGNTWNGFTYDPEFNRIYIGTGNGSPWNRNIRSPGGGDNLFLCSIVALDADTGKYAWHYQTTPGETWDYNSNMDIVLADLTIAGKPVKALLHAPKNGFFYVIDRSTGKLISAEKFGKVDALIHMAAVHSTRTWREIDADHMNQVLQINVTGAFNMSQAAALAMEKTGGGAICLAMSGSIAVSGLGGDGRGGIAYISSKAAIIGVTRGLARSLAPVNIRVNAVSPGSTRTAMTADYSEAAVRHAGAKTLAGRMGEASEIASVALFLISDAAGYVQGEIVNVNGGGSLGL
jgi:NAD(P)-dependent dehydrogenase (short-subunit alcohol dehydrogenase family)